MRKMISFITIIMIISLLNISPYVYADNSGFNMTYGEQLSEDVEILFYNSMINTYVNTSKDDNCYIGLSKEVVDDGKMVFDADGYADMLKFETTGSTSEEAQEKVVEWYKNRVKGIVAAGTNAMHAFLRDYPQVFWIKGFKISSKLTTSITVSNQYVARGTMDVTIVPEKLFDNPNEYIRMFNDNVLTVSNAIEISSYGKDEAARVKAVHDYIAQQVDYNYPAVTGSEKDYGYAFSPLPVFVKDVVEDKVVCQGYAKAFKIICDRIGIQNALLTGIAYGEKNSEYHMWNAVKVGGIWYAVDVTWDDQKSGIVDTYFLAGMNTPTRVDSTYSNDHRADTVFASEEGAKSFRIPQVATVGTRDDLLKEKFGYNDGSGNAQNDNGGSDEGKKDDGKDNSIRTKNINVVYNKSVVYTGSPLKNGITISADGVIFKEGTDYKVTYKNNKNVGKASFTVTFIGKYKSIGSFTKTFEIKKVNMGTVKAKKLKVKKVDFKKKKITLNCSFVYNGKKLVKNKDYKISFAFNKKKKSVTVTFKGIGNYTGKRVMKYRIK